MLKGTFSSKHVMNRLTRVSLLILGLTSCASISQPQMIGADIHRWIRYSFSEGTAIVTTRVPPGLRVRSTLPELTYKRAQRLLLDAQYDFGAGEFSYTSEFEIKVQFLKLAPPLDAATVGAKDMDRALTTTLGHPIKGPESPEPVEQSIDGRTWNYYDNSTDVTYTQTRDTYATAIDDTTILLITGWYGPNIRKNPGWLESRRGILRNVRDNTSITRQ